HIISLAKALAENTDTPISQAVAEAKQIYESNLGRKLSAADEKRMSGGLLDDMVRQVAGGTGQGDKTPIPMRSSALTAPQQGRMQAPQAALNEDDFWGEILGDTGGSLPA